MTAPVDYVLIPFKGKINNRYSKGLKFNLKRKRRKKKRWTSYILQSQMPNSLYINSY